MKSLNLYLIISTFFLLTSCGSSKENRSIILSSTDDGGSCIKERVSQLSPQALCSGFTGFISGEVAVFYDPINQQPDYTALRVQLSSIPAGVISGDSLLEMYTWHERCNDTKVLSPSAQQFVIQKKSNADAGLFLGESSNGVIKSSSLQYAKVYTSLDLNSINEASNLFGTAPESFANDYFITLVNLSNSDQAVYLGHFPSAGGQAIESLNFLLTPFYANPLTYQSTHFTSELISLHPLLNISSSGSSDDQYHTDMNQFCNAMIN